ncbi:MAG: helix-turn-helix domain-containing protein [bacterium]
MKISKENAEILGLSKAELSIIDSLESKDSKERNMSIVNISRETGIPRTSLYYILPKLERRGFIETKRNNKKIFWRKSSDEDFEKKYIRTIESVTERKISSNSPTPNQDRIKVLYGTEQLSTVFDEITDLPTRTRVFAIQPDLSILDVIKKMPIKKSIAVCDGIKDKHLIMDGMVHEKSIDSIKDSLSDKKVIKELLESFGGRSADMAKLPDNFLPTTHAETYLYEDKVTLLNWDKEIAVIIKDKDIFQLVKEMFNSTKYLMNRYDQNEKIAKKLVDLGV